jgi:gluconolactonase
VIAQAASVVAQHITRLPQHLHYTGEPNAWVRMTRPGQRLHSFLEGACFDKHGNLWLVDVPYGRIFRIDNAGHWRLELSYDGEPHSLKPISDGSFALVDYKHGLMRFSPETSRLENLADGFDGHPFKGLSDLSVAPNGTIWITDSGRTSLTDPTGRVFRYVDDRLELVLSNVPYPNGIALSPDGRFVYVAATRANAVWRLLASSTETPTMAGIYVQLSGGLGPDGLATDSVGRLAIAHAQAGRAFVCDTIGDVILAIRIPEGTWVTSVAFNADFSQLYIVEAQFGSIWKADLRNIEGNAP